MAEELQALPGVRVEAIHHRMVSGVTEGSLTALLVLRTADDAFLELARFEGMERARVALALLAQRAEALDLRPALAVLGAVRALPPQPAVSLSASFVGRRNYTTSELKETLAQAVASTCGIPVEPDEREAPLHLRLVLEHGHARLGLRLARQALHERRWKSAHRPGSLKPPVAAALWRLAGAVPGARALDVCCGAGTLLAEAAGMGARAFGGDRHRDAIAAAAINLHALGVEARLACWDACALPLPNACADVVASNLPWGRQVASEAPLAALYTGMIAELARVLAPGGRAALLTDAPEHLAPGPLRLAARREIGLFGRSPTLFVLSKPAEAA